MDIEKEKFVYSLSAHKNSIEKFLKSEIKLIIKSAELAVKARKAGNALFCKAHHGPKDHENIFQFYCESIALAPIASEELALAYGTRSAFLFHINKYQECITDIERALQITNSDVLKIKLLCRKTKCSSMLNLLVDDKLLDLIELMITKIPENVGKTLMKLFNQVKILHENKPKPLIDDNQPANVMQDIDEKENKLDYISLLQNEKYGRYLVASRDIKPGEIIWVEKFYASCLSLNKRYTNCHHCFATCWSGIPCNCCNWAMFCSEKCYKEAMEQYHNVECSIISYLNNLSLDFFHNIHLSIRTLLLGLKETGSIKNLRKAMESVDESYECTKDILNTNETPNKFATVYKLTSNISDQDFQEYSVLIPTIMIVLVKYSLLFGEDYYQLRNIQDLINNEDFIWVGSLLRKLIKIQLLNAYRVSHLFSTTTTDENSYNTNINESLFPSQIGSGLALISSLVNHSCIPNIRRCFTRDKRIFFYALKPIEKGSQLFDCYYGCFSDMAKATRHSYLIKHQFTCDCPACVNDWTFEEDYFPNEVSSQHEIEIFEKLQFITRLIYGGSGCNYSDIIKLVSKFILQASKCLPQQSSMICLMCDFFGELFDSMYGFEKNVYESCT